MKDLYMNDTIGYKLIEYTGQNRLITNDPGLGFIVYKLNKPDIKKEKRKISLVKAREETERILCVKGFVNDERTFVTIMDVYVSISKERAIDLVFPSEMQNYWLSKLYMLMHIHNLSRYPRDWTIDEIVVRAFPLCIDSSHPLYQESMNEVEYRNAHFKSILERQEKGLKTRSLLTKEEKEERKQREKNKQEERELFFTLQQKIRAGIQENKSSTSHLK